MTGMLLKLVLALLKMKPKPIYHLLKRHFGRSPQKFPVVQITFPLYRHACLALALQQYFAVPGRRAVTVGTNITSGEIKIADFIHPESFSQQTEGPVQFTDMVLNDGTNVSCPERVLYLLRERGQRLAIYITRYYDDEIVVEAMAAQQPVADTFLAELRRLADVHSIYRGQAICMKEDYRNEMTVTFQRVPKITRSQLILPDEVMEQIEYHSTKFSSHRELLLARGRHLKRGLLLYGPPGTGKSLTIMYLIGQISGRTTILLNGSSSTRYLEAACTLARMLAPSTVVIDDADLIAEERTRRNGNPILFDLLNQMDGIADDSDVLFLLTTDRPETLEPALAERPGRIDQTILVPLPDSACRRRLFDLYSKGLPYAVRNVDKLIEKTDNVSAAFIRELFRKATVLAIDEGPNVQLQDRHMEKALHQLKGDNSLTARLLGAKS